MKKGIWSVSVFLLIFVAVVGVMNAHAEFTPHKPLKGGGFNDNDNNSAALTNPFPVYDPSPKPNFWGVWGDTNLFSSTEEKSLITTNENRGGNSYGVFFGKEVFAGFPKITITASYGKSKSTNEEQKYYPPGIFGSSSTTTSPEATQLVTVIEDKSLAQVVVGVQFTLADLVFPVYRLDGIPRLITESIEPFVDFGYGDSASEFTITKTQKVGGGAESSSKMKSKRGGRETIRSHGINIYFGNIFLGTRRDKANRDSLEMGITKQVGVYFFTGSLKRMEDNPITILLSTTRSF